MSYAEATNSSAWFRVNNNETILNSDVLLSRFSRGVTLVLADNGNSWMKPRQSSKNDDYRKLYSKLYRMIQKHFQCWTYMLTADATFWMGEGFGGTGNFFDEGFGGTRRRLYAMAP